MSTWLAAGIVIAAIAVLRGVIRKHGAGALLWRFLAGHHLDGRVRTDAGYLRRGVRVMHPTGHASRWSHLPHVARAGIRIGGVLAGAGICVGLATDERVTVLALAVVGVVLVGLALVLGYFRAREWRHTRTYVRPLHRALAPQLGIPLAVRPQSWLTVPRDFGTVDGARVRLQLPEGMLATADVKRVISTALSDKLALEGTQIEWSTVGKAPAAIVTTSTPPPAKVTFGHLAAEVAAARESAPVIGLGRNGSIITADYEADSPHVLVSAGSGGGKSTIVRGLAAQGLHNGGLSVICDIKRISHTWARGLPNVFYSRDIEEIHNMLIRIKGEVDRRNVLVDELADENGDVSAEALAQIGPRIQLVMEEMNATANRLTAYWRKTREKTDPTVSPAVEALADILFMGRAVMVNVIAVAQMMTAKTLGGPESRENFATRIMARYTVNAWKMLVPEVWPMPRRSNHPGRVQVVIAGAARETQVVYFTPAEAREWAMSGSVSRFVLPEVGELPAAGPDALGEPATPSLEPHHVDIQPVAATGGVALVGAPGDAPIGLSEACEAGIVSAGLAAVRSARARDPEFPRAVGKRGAELLYSAGALARWESNRPMAKSDEAEEA
jgi:hypothetical protein